ncbi:MAG: GNAT family N-acetyltransferase [Methanoregulaceae archaeon]|jgi:RimJ/RimL family protein N-acetyltransferase|nr:GNAT family N-acetyltransferase [Methanoregulaceae archaeon]
MLQQPDLLTPRLHLRPFTEKDASEVSRLAGDPAISQFTLDIPYPYDQITAQNWIRGLAISSDEGTEIIYAITLRDKGILLGAIGLMKIDTRNERARVGYWIGLPYWNKGYATEALASILGYGFRVKGLNRINAYFMTENRASGRVLEKCGMRYEGTMRQHIRKGDRYKDIAVYGILREDYTTPVPD